jgi:hypothetical protein
MRKTAIRLHGRFIVLLLLFTSAAVVKTQTSPNIQAKPRRVFINLTGDEKTSQRVWTLLGFDIEDEGMVLSTTESGVDVVISGRITRMSEKDIVRLGVVRMEATAGNSTRKSDSCASLHQGPGEDELFGGSGKVYAEQLRDEYPKAKSVRVDPASDLTPSKEFAAEFTKSLKESRFSVVYSGSADLTVKVALVAQKVAIQTETLHYEISIAERGGMHRSQRSGDNVISAKLAEKPPAACPESLEDLSWLSQSDAFCGLAREIVADIMGKKSRPGGTTKCQFTPH